MPPQNAGRIETSFLTCRDAASAEARHEIDDMKGAGLPIEAVSPAEAEDVHLACELAAFCDGLDDEDRLEAVLVSLRGGPREAAVAALILSTALLSGAQREGKAHARSAALAAKAAEALEGHRERQTTLATRLFATRLLATFRLNNDEPEAAADHIREAALGGDGESKAIIAMMTCCERRDRDEALCAIADTQSLLESDGEAVDDGFTREETRAIVEGIVAAIVFHSPLVDEPAWRERMLAAIAQSGAREAMERRQAGLGPEIQASHLAFADELGFRAA